MDYLPFRLSWFPLLTDLFPSMDNVETPPQLTAVTLAELWRQAKAQLEAWQHATERHERIALALETPVSQDKLEKWLEEIGKKIEGFGNI